MMHPLPMLCVCNDLEGEIQMHALMPEAQVIQNLFNNNNGLFLGLTTGYRV